MKNQNPVHEGSGPLDTTPRTIVTAMVSATRENMLDRTSFWRKDILAFHDIMMGNNITVSFDSVSDTRLFALTRMACRVLQLTNKIRHNVDSDACFETRIDVAYFCRAVRLHGGYVPSDTCAVVRDYADLNHSASGDDYGCNPPKGCVSHDCAP